MAVARVAMVAVAVWVAAVAVGMVRSRVAAEATVTAKVVGAAGMVGAEVQTGRVALVACLDVAAVLMARGARAAVSEVVKLVVVAQVRVAAATKRVEVARRGDVVEVVRGGRMATGKVGGAEARRTGMQAAGVVTAVMEAALNEAVEMGPAAQAKVVVEETALGRVGVRWAVKWVGAVEKEAVG